VIDEALGFLRDQLMDHALEPLGQPEETVGFLDGDDMDPIKFKYPITVLLINIEKETVLRAADPFKRIAADGSAYQTRPDIRLNLCLLFVAGYKNYLDSLKTISQIISYFQSHTVFENPSVGRLTMELLTLPLAEQNELWSALGTPYRPSVMYRVRMLVFEDRHETSTVPVSQIETEIVRAHHAAS
jgi:hypothetical protein